MRNEHERNMNVLRGLLHLFEEGAADELNDGSDGSEPWTEDDRLASGEKAEWIRTTFFTPPKATSRGRPKTRPNRGEPLWSDDELWTELDSTDPERREAAVAAIDALAKLASVRARLRGTSFLIERHAVYDVELLNADIGSDNAELHDDAWDEVTHAMALADTDDVEWTEADQQWAESLRARIKERLDELRRANAEHREDGAP